MTAKKFLSGIFGAISQKCDPEKILLPREINRVLKQFRAIAMTLIFRMDHQILEQNHETAFRCADRKQQIDHPHDGPVTAQNENSPPVWLFENQPQSAQL